MSTGDTTWGDGPLPLSSTARERSSQAAPTSHLNNCAKSSDRYLTCTLRARGRFEASLSRLGFQRRRLTLLRRGLPRILEPLSRSILTLTTVDLALSLSFRRLTLSNTLSRDIVTMGTRRCSAVSTRLLITW